MKIGALAVFLISVTMAGCTGVKTVTLAEIRTPAPAWINSTVVTEGFLQSHVEEELLTREKSRFSDPVELSFAPMFAGVPAEKRLAQRMEIGRRLSGKWVSVRGKIRVGPFGVLGRPTVYLEVEKIEEANSEGSVAP